MRSGIEEAWDKKLGEEKWEYVDPISSEVRDFDRRVYIEARGGRLVEWVTDSGIVVRQDIRLLVPRNSLYSGLEAPEIVIPDPKDRGRGPFRKRSVFGFCVQGTRSGPRLLLLPRTPSRSISRTYTSSTRITSPPAGIYSGQPSSPWTVRGSLFFETPWKTCSLRSVKLVADGSRSGAGVGRGFKGFKVSLNIIDDPLFEPIHLFWIHVKLWS